MNTTAAEGGARRVAAAAAGLLILVAGACYRPAAQLGPLPGALSARTTASVREAAVASRAALSNFGLPLLFFRLDSGLVESDWFDIATLRSEAQAYPPEERMVSFRFAIVADSSGRTTLVFLETLAQTVGNQFGSRLRRRLVPSDHPAMGLARELLERVRRDLEN